MTAFLARCTLANTLPVDTGLTDAAFRASDFESLDPQYSLTTRAQSQKHEHPGTYRSERKTIVLDIHEHHHLFISKIDEGQAFAHFIGLVASPKRIEEAELAAPVASPAFGTSVGEDGAGVISTGAD